jgi:hypothetical protein
VPVTATEKVAVCPIAAFWLTGCVVIDGAVGAASALVALLPVPLFAPARPVQPEREKTAKRTTRRPAKLGRLFKQRKRRPIP